MEEISEIKNRSSEVYDIETIKGVFTYSAINIDTKQIVKFVLHKNRFELVELYNHLRTLKGQIGFNNLNFDYPIIHYIIKNYHIWCEQLSNNKITYEEIVHLIYKEAQRIIEVQNNKQPTAIKSKDVLIPQLDLFRVWHYSNKARWTSLKALEISMNFPNVMEMPIEHTEENITLEQIEEVLEYNINDILATYEFYKITDKLDKISLRKDIQSKYKLPCLNWNNGKIGEELILKLYCEKTGKSPWDVKELRSYRSYINLAHCIPSIINFKSKEFNILLDFFKNRIVSETRNSADYNLIFKNIRYDYGVGGIHACIEPGVYESNDYFIIKTCDVSSLYPNLPIVFNFTIGHLGPEFLDVYSNEIVNKRLAEKAKPKDQQDKSIIDGYKEGANIPYGKSNDQNSFLYDPLYMMKTTISGQLVLSMLCERLSEIPESQILMVNTDGLEIRIPRKYEELYNSICNKWQQETKLVLEFDDYQKMWLRDINNYGCITTKGKIKNKGAFEVDKMIGSEPAYHKDNSFKIIPLAIQEYFVNNTPIETTILNHKNIYDFCGRQKFGRDSYGEIHKIVDNNIITTKQQKNVRYYISNNGDIFIKQYSNGSSEIINKGYKVTIFNNYIEREIQDYNINYKFYIKEANKIVNLLESKQIKLF